MTKCGVSKSADDTKLRGMAAASWGHAAVQRDLDRLEEWSDRSPMKFHKERCKVLHLRKSSPMHQDMMGASQLGSSLAEKDLGVLVDSKLNMIQQSVYLSSKGGEFVWIAPDKYCQEVEGSDPSSLYRTGETKA
ncbi:hypothetical protein DUI87_15698 [Hirundo rustica rustica]|uniref:Uncharacterized protein n=1 Tax=Hirundo rustica rustica TaxID=333673 RepID=A0A3M0KGL7_HIRRU|nr:hypothetical protein DUI87_15698 [Hirundo rustica rustica]